MERWTGRVAMVTGASGGMGKAVVKALVNKGVKVVGLDRQPVDPHFSESLKNAPGKLYSIVTDLTKEEEILSAFSWMKKNLGGVDIMVNVAGFLVAGNLAEGETSDWKKMFDVNVIALSICTREAIKSMKERGVDDGYIIHIASIAGVRESDAYAVSMYGASKRAVRGLTEGLRRELNQMNSRIRVTVISPGTVLTPFVEAIASQEDFKKNPFMETEDIADAIMYLLSTPLRVQVHEMIIQPNGATH